MEKLNTSPQKEKTWHGRRENRAAGGKQHHQRREVDCLWSGPPPPAVAEPSAMGGCQRRSNLGSDKSTWRSEFPVKGGV